MSNRGIRVWKTHERNRHVVGSRRRLSKEDRILGTKVEEATDEKQPDSPKPPPPPPPFPYHLITKFPLYRPQTSGTSDGTNTRRPRSTASPSTSEAEGTSKNPHSATSSTSRGRETPYPHSSISARSSSSDGGDTPREETRDERWRDGTGSPTGAEEPGDSSRSLEQSYDFAKAEEEEELRRRRETLLLEQQIEEEHRQLEEALSLETEEEQHILSKDAYNLERGEEQYGQSKEGLSSEREGEEQYRASTGALILRKGEKQDREDEEPLNTQTEVGKRNRKPKEPKKLKKEETNEDERNRQRKKMGSERPRVVLTWVERNAVPPDIAEANKDLRKAMTKATPPGTLYSICETYDTYQHGGLFPMMHVSDDSGAINKLLNGGAVLDKAALGEGLKVDQGVFEEVANVRLAQDSSSNTEKLIAVACFKSIEKKLNPTLIKEWKAWTGARAFLQDLVLSGLHCSSIKFLIRLAPYTSNETFYYVLMTEISVTESSDEATFVDALQRFRVERWFGYQTVYKSVE
ncbi:uncharacterized protein LOC143028291 [Oratosquilla oratoria]|uniref:uncharacterized protein LOC143028291 n=1 Tax=Oratosquilla oratoria TaxID=337810 RepID=UPI003F760816